MLCAVEVVRGVGRDLLCEHARHTLFTPTRLARLPPMGPFLVWFPAAGALWRRFLPKMSCASCSFLRF